MYDLSWFLENGDIPEPLASKWRAWQAAIRADQEQYRGLVGLRA